ncbi:MULTISPECIES: hypothetical protein [Streptomycetaceae]|uniref:Uncharacterized protein n=1 Tax=Streptantibioticus cattleyicolor (strain ATCC 35852 / DSM 46488 / JCM 4925 / NBRC 14057 / NRRL 8057) TaxID=1003195 RepID=G8WXV9_STREN|nr:hypothetical protein [Streptantibioticus cattleyicolor]AEW97259.1 hypothetical protein SCATT_48880 [Streptantibioticus cattleyicolor NRRL 8057 = DSM 46488]
MSSRAASAARLPGLAARLVRSPGATRTKARAARFALRAAEDVRHGRLERSLALLTAAGSAITAAEIYLEHDRAGFGNRVMWWPVLLGPVGVAAGVAAFRSERAAHTALPLASAAIAANGLQGTYLHVRGIAQKPGGWRMARYNVEMGPPLFAPLLMSMVGGMGLLASVLRRER